MKTNCSLQSLSRIGFGYSFIANQKAMKMRYSLSLADAILNRIPTHFHKSLSLCKTENKGKAYGYIACIAFDNSAIWPAINKAIKLAKIDELRALASRKEAELEAEEYNMPFAIDLPW